MLTAPRGSQTSDHLDMVRGIASLGVFLGHARNLFFVDYPQVVHKNFFVYLYYCWTGIGHEWVMVFFVLSGFFIASSVSKDLKASKWSWSKYLKNRFLRLYIVLLPALFLTIVWDQLGIAISNNGPLYQGIGDSNIVHNVSERTSIGTVAGNSLFVQNIFVPCLGSNGPLWSLSNEFWYYILFPCILLLMSKSALLHKGVCALIVLTIAIVGFNLLGLFPVWLMGAGLALMPRLPILCIRMVRRMGIALTSISFLVSLAAARIHFFQNSLLSDYCVGASFSCLMLFILHNNDVSCKGWYSFLATRLAGMSYTLYLAHLPFLIFLCVIVGLEKRWQPDLLHMSIGGIYSLIAFVYALTLSLITEARSNQFRQFVARVFSLPESKASTRGIGTLQQVSENRFTS